MTCGHNGKPSELEKTLLTIHLDQAGFLIVKQFDQLTTFTPSLQRVSQFEGEPQTEPIQIANRNNSVKPFIIEQTQDKAGTGEAESVQIQFKLPAHFD